MPGPEPEVLYRDGPRLDRLRFAKSPVGGLFLSWAAAALGPPHFLGGLATHHHCMAFLER